MANEPAQPQANLKATSAYRHRSFDFTVAGLGFCTLMSLMGVAASRSQANLLVIIFGAMVGMLGLSIWICPKMLKELVIRRSIPEHGTVGQPLVIQYELKNQKRWWPTMSVTLAELDGIESFARPPQTFVLNVAPRGSAMESTEFQARRRGLYHLHRLRTSSTFPFGFVKRAMIQQAEDAILIYPAIGRVHPRVLQMCRPAESAGARMRPQQGGDEEFYGVKEHRAGENPRLIYWRRSARTGTLVAKEMSRVSPPRVVLLVDTFLANPTPEGLADVERAIAMAGSLASAALEQGLPVGLLARTSEWLHIAPTRGKRHRRDILTALARLPVNHTHDQHKLVERASHENSSGTTMLLFTPTPRRASLGDAVRGSLVVLDSTAAEAKRWFTFAETVNFSRSAPVSQPE